ncbi:hypothetical protein FD29_GL000062 [Companilactobacillus mindensis DSM 14500]|jgi:hypothetical protein|uniref:S-layer protein C-terminal domain-containing protein n=1 Tax=Companilactobacillus mindensis DSM 14500 TaxID=1423770 RepID=A0A0R1QTL0_9LACO|nr:SLAP domain-containing protein [Companilactobacillus mindensis]KRL44408.1 hypothetical protein FD29_GL000062 [Companilactobacillus mindensis DSM 14500]GEO79773.1 hypothetical protein LMI01_21040 [Companilactobacillus mindensis]
MKLLQKSLLFASLLAVGTSVASIPTITNGNGTVQAATTTKTTKHMTADGFYYRVSNDRFIKASDVMILNENNQSDSSTFEDVTPDTFKLEVVSPKADLYNLEGKKVGKPVAQGTVCTVGSSAAFAQSTYYKVAKDKLAQVRDSSWL